MRDESLFVNHAKLTTTFQLNDMAGSASCVMFALECMIRCPLDLRKRVKRYLDDDVVLESIKKMPFVGVKLWEN